jgi:hypothetical protein
VILLRRLVGALRHVILAVGYLALMVVTSLGSAGIVALFSHPPGTAARAELTAHADSILSSELDAARSELALIADRVDHLAVLARGALAALEAEDRSPVNAALTEGSLVAGDIETGSANLASTLLALPGDGPTDAVWYGGDLLARRTAMIAAVDVTQGLGRSWAILTAGSLQASRLIDLLQTHDTTVADAAAQGRSMDYDGAIATLAAALVKLDKAVDIRDQLANASDVSTLDDWIGRNRRYDEALTALYTALRDAGGTITDEVRKAYTAEGEARAQLPADTRALVVIVADAGRGGLNQAVIAIEQAKGRLNLALDTLSTDVALEPGGPGG